ncbi:Hint domain-containing protein [Rhodobacter capsulatus]|uniref:Hint domain-containing protein n=1 Tax=Rhodobacter capsulatus TaxID=1061 RepID=UPI00402A5AFD
MDRQATGRDEAEGVKGPAGAVPSFTLETRVSAAGAHGVAGLAPGTRVATMDGLLPVEFLTLGDRIVTRSGMRVLRGLSSLPLVSRLVGIAPGALGHDRPGQAMVLGSGTPVLLRDWRAEAMFGTSQALVAVARLIDGQFVTRLAGRKIRIFALHFEAPEVIYADGVEIGCKPLTLRA